MIPEILQEILPLDIVDATGGTALHTICQRFIFIKLHQEFEGYFEQLKTLLQMGANPNIKNDCGMTPILCLSSCWENILEARVGKISYFRDAYVYKGTEFQEIFDILLEHGAIVSLLDKFVRSISSHMNKELFVGQPEFNYLKDKGII